MANEKHLKILEQRPAIWNQWRKENPKIKPDLSRADLSNANLHEADLSNADLLLADFRGANLINANLRNANLYGAKLGTGLEGRSTGANLSGADLTEATLQGARLMGVNLSWASLSNANVESADFRNANLTGADLGGAELGGADFSGADLKGAKVNEARIGATLFGINDLSVVVGLGTVRHSGRSFIGTDTLEWTAAGVSGDSIYQAEVEAFLRGAGVPEDYIEFFRSRIGNPLQFYSAFISYSHADKSFARRLYEGLQMRGIRCWLDDKDMRVGDRILDAVNQAIRVYDKVLLCCSNASLTSSWVEDEIAMAFEKERECRSLTLIPLDLDRYLFESWTSGKAPRIRERLAADFTGWDHDNAKFEEQFEKVVWALQADKDAKGEKGGHSDFSV